MPNLYGDSNVSNVAAVFGNNSNGGTGVFGKSISGWGIHGMSNTSTGVSGTSTNGWGTHGHSETNTGVAGTSTRGWGTSGFSETNTGVVGMSKRGWGIQGRSERNIGVMGESTGSDENGRYHPGVLGVSRFGTGVVGDSEVSTGVHGKSDRGEGVYAESNSGAAIVARNHSGDSPALFVNHRGTGNLIEGRDRNNVEVFRVLNNGDVQVRGITLTSDKNAKKNFSSVNTLEILDNLASLPIQSWSYKDDTSSERHIGPTAQGFHAAFGLNGEDETKISSTDLHGVALAAIQGLNKKLKVENDELHAKLASLEERLSTLESKS
ncbi:tail fiber domain-containing protein [Paenibacillus sp. A3]|uniref:tail fiber domain-containing protein n=1 Tax=Paenibacillus sp. A3 TaxID=1337054 RepID=UPI0006D58DB8|nr:tail fiber domain-containing protein [Paenibacillus sp. A3]